uniref:Putative ras gtpase effector rassf2 n=1 Tax=Lutzomyia longipalpis TaxID=7200 RepID=A0A1B0CI23_LUTLO
MWKCRKCGKSVYFAERKQSLGYDWHPECLRCEECGKRLNPGQHAEHKGVPYCHVPCYGALFGPQLFGHGTRVESHKSFGQHPKGNDMRQLSNGGGTTIPREQLETKLKLYNQFFDNKSMEIRSREVNGRLVLEGAIRVYWGVQGVIHLKEDDDQRTVVTVRKRNSCRYRNSMDVDPLSEFSDNSKVPLSPTVDMTASITSEDGLDLSTSDSTTCDTCTWSEDVVALGSESSSKDVSPSHKSATLPPKLDVKQLDWDEIDDLLQVERRVDETEKIFRTMPSPLPSQSSTEFSSAQTLSQDYTPDSLNTQNESEEQLITAASHFSQDTTGDESTECSTLKPEDFEDFKKRIQEEFISSTNMMGNTNNTLKSNEPIDPSRINDSLKLYSENIMSKSFNGMPSSMNNESYEIDFENAFQPYETILQKLDSEGFTDTSETTESLLLRQGLLSKSKSGPNCFSYGDDQDDDVPTLKPSTVKRNPNFDRKGVSIKMDCYDELQTSSDSTTPRIDQGCDTVQRNEGDSEEAVVLRKPPKTGSTAIKRRSGNRRSRTKLKRRCSINGHFYNRETSFFTPPRGSMMSVWITSLVDTKEIINLLLEKYKVDSRPENFALFIVKDNGEQRRLKEEEYPLLVRVMLGPHEDVARIFLVDSHATPEISSEVAQFLNLSLSECRAILDRYCEEQDREVARIKEKYAEMRRRITQRMESLKVRL